MTARLVAKQNSCGSRNIDPSQRPFSTIFLPSRNAVAKLGDLQGQAVVRRTFAFRA